LISADELDGGAGSDRLVTSDQKAAAAPTLENIEKVELSSTNAAADISLENATGVETAEINGGTAAAQFSNIDSTGVALSAASNGGNATFVFTDAALAGDADSVSLTVDGVATGNTIEIDDNTGNGTSVETLNITASGDKSTASLNTGVDPATLNIDGSADLTLDVALETTKTISAADATGEVTVTLGSADQAVTGGSGDDTFVFGGNYTSADTVDGGDGEDTLSISTSIDASTDLGTLTSIEAMEQTGTDKEIDGDLVSDVTRFVGSGTNAGSMVFDDMASGNTYDVLIADGTSDATDNLTVDLETDGSADTGTFRFGDADTAVNIESLTAGDLETVNIELNKPTAGTAHDVDASGDGFSFGDATSVVVTGAGSLTVANIDLADEEATFDASAATGDFDIAFSDAANQDRIVKTGSGDDVVAMAGGQVDDFDTFELGEGDDTIKLTSVGALNVTLDATGAETLLVEHASGDNDFDLDVRALAGLETITVDNTTNHGNTRFDQVASGTVVQLLDMGDATGVTHTINAARGASSITVDLDDVDGTTDDTLTVDNAATVNINQKDNALASSGASVLADLDTNTATTLNISAVDNSLTIDDLSTSVLETVNVEGDEKVTLSGSTAGGANTISVINASSLAADTSGDGLVLGSGSSLFNRADDAVITGSSGADTISFDSDNDGSNVIDAGDGPTTSASEAGDILALGGTMDGDTIIDLSSTTDQVTTLNGVTNSEAQIGFESIDGSNVTTTGSTTNFNVTGSDAANHITTDSGDDVINAGAGDDVIDGNGGADAIAGETGDDTFVYNAKTDGGDTISDFTEGGTDDLLDLNIAVTASDGSANTFSTETGAASLDFGNAGVHVIQANSSNVGSSMTTGQVTTAALGDFSSVGGDEAAYIVLTADTNADSSVEVYHVTANAGGSALDAADHIVTLAGIEADNLTAADFDGFAGS
jgi:hypothetical protein